MGLQIPMSTSHLNGKGDEKPPTSYSGQVTANYWPGCWAQGSIRITPSGCSHFQKCPLHFIPMLRRQSVGGGRGEVFTPLSGNPYRQAPRCAGEVLGKVSHHGVWQGCSSSSTVPLCAFGRSRCAKQGVASKWHPPNLAALPRAGPDLQKCPCAPIRMSTSALHPLLLTVVTSSLFLKAGFCLKGIPESLASPLHAQALSTALSWVFGLKNLCKEPYLKLRVHISPLLT